MAGLGGKIQAGARDRWQDLRDRSGFYQARVALLALYIVVVVLTVIIAPPRAADFELTWDKVPFGLAEVSFVEIANNDLGSKEDLQVEVRGTATEFDGRKTEGKWSGPLASLPEGERTRVKPQDLKDKRGYRAPNEIDIQYVVVRDKDGDIVLKGTPKRKSK